MADRLSGRALATALGVDERAVRKAVEVGRIKRGADGKFDLAEAREQWVRSTEQSRSKVRRFAPRSVQKSAPELRVRSAPLVATGEQLWAVLHQVPGIAAWDAATAGGDLQRCFDAAANLRLNVTGELHLRFGAVLPGDFEDIDWPGLAEDHEMAFVDPVEMLADWISPAPRPL